MASEFDSSSTEDQSFLERLMSFRNRDFSLAIPFLLGFTGSDTGETRPDPDHGSSDTGTPDGSHDRIIIINPRTHGLMVIEGVGLESIFRKEGQPPAAKSAVEAMRRVEIGEGEEGECVICLEEWEREKMVKEMPCKHRFHEECIEKWLGLHGSCPICRYQMPAEEDGGGKKATGGGDDGDSGGERRREIWVSFSLGGGRRSSNGVDESGEVNRTVESEFSGSDLNPSSSDSHVED